MTPKPTNKKHSEANRAATPIKYTRYSISKNILMQDAAPHLQVQLRRTTKDQIEKSTQRPAARLWHLRLPQGQISCEEVLRRRQVSQPHEILRKSQVPHARLRPPQSPTYLRGTQKAGKVQQAETTLIFHATRSEGALLIRNKVRPRQEKGLKLAQNSRHGGLHRSCLIISRHWPRESLKGVRTSHKAKAAALDWQHVHGHRGVQQTALLEIFSRKRRGRKAGHRQTKHQIPQLAERDRIWRIGRNLGVWLRVCLWVTTRGIGSGVVGASLSEAVVLNMATW